MFEQGVVETVELYLIKKWIALTVDPGRHG